ncbi:hypothetical protein [Mucilaginibacter oryzae]|uniref:hypothetical protein n=1 Tax=Mucilaginibacter oryzae TaxID=468058 RepID=UPI0014752BBC|nr:hypothetical protein [Mucilaginibacter oryzae]
MAQLDVQQVLVGEGPKIIGEKRKFFDVRGNILMCRFQISNVQIPDVEMDHDLI